MFWTSTEKKSCSIESVSKLAKLDVLLKICFVAGNIEVLFFYFFLSGFFSRTLATHRTAGDHLLFYSATSTCSRTFRHLFATLNVRWLLHIFNRNACIYQTATRWDLPPYQITIWLIDDMILIFVCLLVDFILGFVTAVWHGRNQWTQTRIGHHPCITSEPTNQVLRCSGF